MQEKWPGKARKVASMHSSVGPALSLTAKLLQVLLPLNILLLAVVIDAFAASFSHKLSYAIS